MSKLNQDIQASHKILSLLEKANDHAEHIIDMLPGVFLIINEHGDILRGNLESTKVFDLSYEALLRTNVSELLRHEIWLLFRHYFHALVKNPSETSIKFELSLSDNHGILTEHPYYWHVRKMEVGNGAEGNLYVVMGEDISQLRESENRLLNVFSSIPLGILTIDETGAIEDSYSSYLECLLGCSNFEGRQFEEVVFDPIMEDLTRAEQQGIKNIYACLNQEESQFLLHVDSFPKQIFYYRDDKKQNGKYLQISYKPVNYEGVIKRLLIIIEDRTAIIEAEKEQQRAQVIEKQSRAVYESAIRDPLTGLYTRLYMEKSVLNRFGESEDEEPLKTLILFDIDHFKRVNDTYGHDVGDVVLKDVSATILQEIAEQDVPIRYGGEELMVFLPGDLNQGVALAERIRVGVESLSIVADEKNIQVTISGGVAAYQEGEDLKQLIKRTDQLLYKAKEQGRNQIIVAD
ncbi:MAG: GGDEF domain-containing protein [Pseudomonadales bacterium]|nr:GGDEF domain-containing protein [Pseudomonadales bacterium]